MDVSSSIPTVQTVMSLTCNEKYGHQKMRILNNVRPIDYTMTRSKNNQYVNVLKLAEKIQLILLIYEVS